VWLGFLRKKARGEPQTSPTGASLSAKEPSVGVPPVGHFSLRIPCNCQRRTSYQSYKFNQIADQFTTCRCNRRGRVCDHQHGAYPPRRERLQTRPLLSPALFPRNRHPTSNSPSHPNPKRYDPSAYAATYPSRVKSFPEGKATARCVPAMSTAQRLAAQRNES
jgi:hypothetical protein